MADQSSLAARTLGARAVLTGAPAGDALENVITNRLDDGARCWVTAENSDFKFVRGSTSAADGVNVIAPIAGPGRWHRAESGTDNVHIYQLCVSPVRGNDDTGDGSLSRPFRTIAKALSEIPPHGNDYDVWADQKAVICLGQGRYTEPAITVRQVRRCVAFQGDGAVIESDIRFVQDRDRNWPDGAAFANANMPEPWLTIGQPLVTWELQGVGGGIEGGQTAMNLIFLGLIEYTWVSSTGGAISFWMVDRIQLKGSFEITSTSPAFQSITVELNDMSTRQEATATHFGSDNSGAGIAASLKAANSQLITRIGPNMRLLEIDNCRLHSLDRDTNFDGTGGAGGTIETLAGDLYSGVTDCGWDTGGTYDIGATGGSHEFLIDEPSLRRMLSTATPTLTSVAFRVDDAFAATTAARPVGVPDGFRMLDTTLGIPIWRLAAVGPSGWIDATGVSV